MRVDPKGTIAGKPALLVRDCLRNLRARVSWDLSTLETAASLEPGTGRPLLRALSAAGLVKSVGRGWWDITQEGQRLSSATAAKPVTRATAEKGLREFLTRVERVNRDARFLGRVNRVVLFGSMLREDVDRVSDVDLAVEVLPKIADRELLTARNRRQVEALLGAGHAFRGFSRYAVLLVSGGVSISEKSQPRNFVGRLCRREVADHERTPSYAARRRRDGLTGTSSGSAAARQTEQTDA